MRSSFLAPVAMPMPSSTNEPPGELKIGVMNSDPLATFDGHGSLGDGARSG